MGLGACEESRVGGKRTYHTQLTRLYRYRGILRRVETRKYLDR